MDRQDIIESSQNKQSITFRLLKKMRLIGDEHKYGKISIFGAIWLLFNTIWRRFIFTYSYKEYLLEPINKKIIRPLCWRMLGCHLGKNVHIGHSVRLDFGNTERIKIGNNVVISNGVNILCHKRDSSNYHKGDIATKLPFKYEDVVIEDNVQIGLNCTIMPGVTIGEGSIIGSCSLVTKSIPAWSIAVGSPAKVVKSIE